MKASELRIGNWVKISDDISKESYKDELKTMEFKIRGFNDSSHTEGSQQILYWGIETILGGRKYSGSRDIDCEPIPLTEEWLVKFGFEIHIVEMVFGNFYLKINGDHFEYYCNNRVELKYVHQLQNLYHALMGEELKEKE